MERGNQSLQALILSWLICNEEEFQEKTEIESTKFREFTEDGSLEEETTAKKKK